MASSNTATSGPSSSEQPASPAPSSDTIILHVLSPSPEVNGGRITFPSIPLDTKISHLKSRIRNSMNVSVPPERQRLIYRGRALSDMDVTIRQVLQSELNASMDQNPTYTLHMIISPAPDTMPAISTSASQNHVPQHGPTPAPGSQAQPTPTVPHQHQHHHHHPLPHVHLPGHPAMAQAQAAQAMLQNQLNQLRQQIAMIGMIGQGPGPGHSNRHGPDQPPQVTPFPPTLPNMQAFQAAIMQQQQIRAQAGMHGMHNAAMNGIPSGPLIGQNAQAPLGPITTRVHETVGPDGQRTRVVVNETTFQISRQSTPVPAANRTQGPQAPEPQNHVPTTSGPQLPPSGVQPNPQHQSSPFPTLPHLPAFEPPFPAYEPTITTTTAWLLSSPSGPQALVFAPGHGLFTTAPPTVQPSTGIPPPHNALRFQQTPSGHIRPPNASNLPVLPALNPAVANAQPHQALEAVVRARNAAAAARQANADANANNDVLRTIMSRVWTFIKLYFVIFMFTEPGTWFRWICLLVAVLVSVMPSTTVFRGFATRLQAHVDGLVPPPAAAAQAPLRHQDEGNRQHGEAAAARRQQGEPDPAATAARLVQEHRQRHPNVLRDTFERVERALGLFVASLIPGVGERHVRAREEARREVERVERERVERERVQAEEEEKRRVEEGKGKEKVDKGLGNEAGEASSAAAGAERKEKENAVAEEPLIQI